MTVTRRHETPDGWRTAVYSDCDRYRYSLTACWDKAGPNLLYVMLNPSKATELANDPTIERCERRARALGYGRFTATNIFALRETSPARLRAAKRPEGDDNMTHIETATERADTILAAWGVHGAHLGQGPRVEQMLRATGKPLVTLGLTKDGHPRHPLYVAYATEPLAW